MTNQDFDVDVANLFAFRVWSYKQGELVSVLIHLGDRLGLYRALDVSGHMTAGELARATGLTTASITGVVDRLEEAGFVTRERDPHDRRRVVVQINLERAVKDVAKIFAPMLGSWREMAARYSDDELRLIVDFYARMEQVFREHLVRLRGGPEAADP